MQETIINISWLVVFISFTVSYLLGWFWYSDALFGKGWRDGIGISPDDNSSMLPAMIAQAIGTFLLALMVMFFVKIQFVLAVIFFAITLSLILISNGLFTQKSKYAIAVEVGYILAMNVVMVVVSTLI